LHEIPVIAEGKLNMAIRTKVPILNPDGKIIEEVGTLVEVVQSKEPWSEYELEDGTKLRIKQTVVNVIKLDRVSDSGVPVYFIQSQQTVSIIPQIKD
jgi:hypothetical protein